ncbi:MarR family winged helix-turn-helix transcriptional regulator [Acidocella sp.]|uniref:MarR family winged helix-turn-helix transcriptional regulator n=1 Tax=Acidocella sp. TaxID=50710 RepID=UPI00260D337E|nr:MarR family transcriptional regulator [Acidocella sp.]
MDYEHDLLILMMVVARLTRVEADRRARQFGMTRAQWGILKQVFFNPGLTQRELANLLEVEPITAARLVDRLQKAGLIERRADAQDRRIWRLHLLPAATPYLEEIDRQRQDITAFITAGLAEADREVMTQALKLMKANLLRGTGGGMPKGCHEKLQENA